MSNFQKPRGTKDFFYDEIELFDLVKDKLSFIANLFNFTRIETPIFEDTSLFLRNKDDTSDMINKEMYTFNDKSNRSLSLRPEGTTSVIRAVVENKLEKKTIYPIKFFYIGPMFRYERPQSGRLRQFHQYGIEIINIKSIYDEIDAIVHACEIIKVLEIGNTTLKINYIGSFETRKKWIDALKKYFNSNSDELSAISKTRINTNPLRILDDKIDSKKNVVINCPKINQFLDKNEISYLQQFKQILNENNINFEYDYNLVRGLDYYTGIVFEIISNDPNLSSQSTLIAGGKYDNMVKEIGGLDVECFGFALGIERIMIALENKKDLFIKNNIDIYFANLDLNNLSSVNSIVNNLRKNNFKVECLYTVNKLEKHLNIIKNYFPKIVLFFGNREKNNDEIIIKNQSNMNQKTVKICNLIDELKKEIKNDY